MPAVRPRPDAPVLVYVHGGGWCYGSIETVDRLCRRIADRSGCAVLSVGYRLAPEHPFPAAARRRRDGAGLRPQGGRRRWASTRPGWRSAGTAPAASWPPSRPGASGTPPTPLDYQVLIYPAIDPMMASESYAELGGYGLDRASMELAWETYVPDPAQRFSPDVAPLAADLAGMPPTLIITAEYDVLRDEGDDYADALLAAGVPVVHVRYLG